MRFRVLNLLVLFGLVSVLSTGFANEKVFGDYSIHYSAFKSDFLSAPMARAYNITRSKNRAVLNVTITHKGKDGLPHPVEANVEGRAFNVYQQAKPIQFREVKDEGSVYYIAEFPVANEEIVNFEISVSKDGKAIGKVSFQQQFFLK